MECPPKGQNRGRKDFNPSTTIIWLYKNETKITNQICYLNISGIQYFPITKT